MGRSLFALAVGLAVLGGGIGATFLEAPPLPRGPGASWILTAFGASCAALLAAFLARPRGAPWLAFGTWPLAALVAAALPAVAFVDRSLRKDLLPAAAQIAGGLAVVVSVLAFFRSRLRRSMRPRQLDGRSKVQIERESGDRKVPAVSLVPGDLVHVAAGEEIPADGTIVRGQGFVDERPVTGAPLPAAKRPGDVLLAGSTSAIPELVMRVEAALEESLHPRRERVLQRVLERPIDRGWVAVAAAAIAFSITIAAAVIAISSRGASQIALWLPLAGGLFIAGAGVAPSLALASGRAAFLRLSRDSGLVPTRIRDLDQIPRTSRWQVDPALLAAPGAVEIYTLAEDAAEEVLLAAACALIEGARGPEALSLRTALAEKEIPALRPAALRRTQAVFHGTAAGARWYMGPRGALEADEAVRVSADAEPPIADLNNRGWIVWLIGRPDRGVLGVIGIEVAVDPEVAAAAKTLRAALLPGLHDTARRALAKAAGITCDGPPLTRRDASLLADGSERPSEGLAIRVVDPRPGLTFRSGASPRLLKPAVTNAPTLHRAARRIGRLATLLAFATAVFPPLAAGLLAAAGWLDPIGGTAVAVVSIAVAAAPHSLSRRSLSAR